MIVTAPTDYPLIFLIFLRADPLWIAIWSVVSLLMMYCGSSLEACRW